MVLRVRVLPFFHPGAPGPQRREHSGVKPLLHTAYRNHRFVAAFEVACLMDTWVAETMPISTPRLAARALALLSRTSSLDLPKPFVLIRLGSTPALTSAARTARARLAESSRLCSFVPLSSVYPYT